MISKISLTVFLISILIFPQNDLRIISSDVASLVIEYSPQFTDTSIFKIENAEYRNTRFLNALLTNEEDWGARAEFSRFINVGVPNEFGTTLEILSTVYKELPGKIIPVPEVDTDGDFPIHRYKASQDYFSDSANEELVTFGDFGIARGVKIQSFHIHPVKSDPNSNTIKLYSKIVFRVNFSGAGSISSIPADDLIKDAILNFDVAKYWNESSSKSLNKITSNSVLSNGKWFRFEAPEEGMYKIPRSALAALGIDVSTVDPRTIKIYNNGGKALSENITQSRPNDLVENAITIVGESDGKFDEADYIIFYGRGSSFWDKAADSTKIVRYRHSYSDKNYFWITSGGNNGKRIESKLSLNQTPDFVQNTTQAFAHWEVDRINLGKSGKQFFGDDFSSSVSTRTYVNSLFHRNDSAPINYNFRFAVGTQNGMQLTISENGNQIYTANLSGFGSQSYTAGVEHKNSMAFNGQLLDSRSSLTFKVNPTSVSSIGYLDYFEIQYLKNLNANADELLLFANGNIGVVEYQVKGFSNSNIKVYDVSDYSNIKVISNPILSGGECKYLVNEISAERKKYFVLGNDKFKSIINSVEVPNSNLHGETTGAEFVIITHKNFIEAANRLKTYRESQALIPVSTIIIDVDKIYNEFSCGILDVAAIRDYLKYAYENWQIKPKYALLFGKGTYDYRNIEGYSDNFIPTYQTEQSLALLNSYVTDDFFFRVDGPDLRVDIAPGRIPVTTLTEANNIVSKIIRYENSSSKGPWRNNVTFVADDGLGRAGSNEGAEHTRPSEEISETIIPKHFDKRKIYSASYPDVITGQGRRKPEVNQEIINAINDGTLFMNFIGHGSPELWTHEVIFEKSVSLPQMKNDKYFFMCAATCDFGYFDIPNFQAAAEAMMFLPNTGSIAAFTSARLVFSWNNHILNRELVNQLFLSSRDTLNLPVRMGTAVFATKQSSFTSNDQKYTLFGDPTMRLLMPQYNASVDSINGQNLSSNVQIKALSKTKIDGRILQSDNSTWSDYTGEAILTVFDSERDIYIEPIRFTAKIPGGTIFKGRVSITNGNFSSDFVVPKDISYENKNGKIVLYFTNATSDGVGFTSNVIVGGTDTTTNDGKGPEIEIFFDDVSFANSYLVGPTPNLIVKLFDETGLNTTGTGIGHKLEGILNENENNPLDFTKYFTGDLDAGGRSGQVNYKFNPLEFGEYSLDVKAWDVFNNFSTQTAYFTVVNDGELVVREIYNYPNPFSGSTTFTFQQNLTNAIDVKIKVYTIAGRMIKEIERFNVLDKYVTIDWDGRDQDGDMIGNGAYLYKIIVKTVDGETSKSVTGKLAVIR